MDAATVVALIFGLLGTISGGLAFGWQIYTWYMAQELLRHQRERHWQEQYYQSTAPFAIAQFIHTCDTLGCYAGDVFALQRPLHDAERGVTISAADLMVVERARADLARIWDGIINDVTSGHVANDFVRNKWNHRARTYLGLGEIIDAANYCHMNLVMRPGVVSVNRRYGRPGRYEWIQRHLYIPPLDSVQERELAEQHRALVRCFSFDVTQREYEVTEGRVEQLKLAIPEPQATLLTRLREWATNYPIAPAGGG